MSTRPEETNISRALLVRHPWIDMILDGKKTWEIHGSRTGIKETTD